jgi:hypothetical protein
MEPANVRAPATSAVNIGPRERRRRLLVGVGLLALGAASGTYLLAVHVDRVWRVPIFIPLWAGATGVLQWRARTCVALAARGMRNLDTGYEPVPDPQEVRQLKLQARRINLQSACLAAALTAAIIALP